MVMALYNMNHELIFLYPSPIWKRDKLYKIELAFAFGPKFMQNDIQKNYLNTRITC